jgi:hypothetical protein
MTLFVHICDVRAIAAIKRSGLTLPKQRFANYENASYKRGVFAMPVTSDFFLTHQWVRELMRRGWRQPWGVYFRIPDDTRVWMGRYNESKVEARAAQAAARLMQERALGFETIIPRAITSQEIEKFRPAPILGWRYFPAAKGAPPKCLCSYCVGGQYNSRKMRVRLDPDGKFD